MSIFHKRGSAVPEMLFGSGAKGADTPSTPGRKNGVQRSRPQSASAELPAHPETRHDVFYVRGRPFIAPATGSKKRLTPRQELFEPHSAKTSEAHEHELSLRRASIISSGEQQHARRASVILTTHSNDAALRADRLIDAVAHGDIAHAHAPAMSRRESAPRRVSTGAPATPGSRYSSRPEHIAAAMSERDDVSHLTPAGANGQLSANGRVRSSLADAGKIAEEEWAALFRNNLLRSCWKPGLSADEVQHILTRWERKLVECMHHLLHPKLFAAFRVWHHGTWPTTRIREMRRRKLGSIGAPALRTWRSAARIRALRPFLYARLSLGRFRHWRAHAAHRRRRRAIYLLFPFRRLQAYTAYRHELAMYLRGLLHSSARKALLTWQANLADEYDVEQSKIAVVLAWRSPTRRALNTWMAAVHEAHALELVMRRWSQYSLYRLWRRWSVTFVKRMSVLRSAVMRWNHQALTQGYMTWLTATRTRAHALHVLTRGVASFVMAGMRAAFNSWRSNTGSAESLRARMSSAIKTLRGGKTRLAWNAWLEAAETRAHHITLMYRAAAGLNSRLLWGFHAWASALQPADSEIARALGHLFHRLESSGFNRWRAFTEESLDAHDALHRAVSAFVLHHQRRAMNAWSESTHINLVKSRALMALRGNGLLRGLNK